MKIRLCAALAVLGLAGCAASVPPAVLPFADASDPHLATGQTRYRAVVTNYEHREAVSPKPWRRTAPSAEGDGS
ncbi:hypothetical protein [Mesorhizobium sp. Z1-4]|uniref:hypothetical protein n=1 Tax=Mesorhizobium sp. Z1-4 TaxID=2448478 RepID=UPI000FD7217E|nr:hypothetical protein [Mesorhizobium sp. Z1-4]